MTGRTLSSGHADLVSENVSCHGCVTWIDDGHDDPDCDCGSFWESVSVTWKTKEMQVNTHIVHWTVRYILKALCNTHGPLSERWTENPM